MNQGRSVRARRGRLALALGLGAAAWSAATTWGSLALLDRARERRVQEELEGGRLEVERALEQLGKRLTATLASLQQALETDHRDQLLRLIAAGPPAVGDARMLMRLAGLDLLEFVDARGTVVSSGHWPERAGLTDPAAERLPELRPRLVALEQPAGAGLALVVRRPLVPGRLAVVGGVRLGPSFLEGLSRCDASVLFGAPGTSPLVAGRGGELDLRAASELARATEGSARRALTGPWGNWPAIALTLRGEASVELGAIVLAVDRGRLDQRLVPLRSGLLLLGGTATVVAALAGLWIASRLARPAAELVRAVEAIAAGRADYTFPRRVERELDELPEAFSRLVRSLDLERQRAVASERVAAWREVARHVAHEVKNPLAPIRLTVQNLQRARVQDPRLFDELFDEGARAILEEVERLRRLVQEFSEFARLPSPAPRPIELAPLIDGVLGLWSAQPGLTLVCRHEELLPPLFLDPDQISQALTNVVGNAVEAMRDGEASPGRLSVRTSREGEMARIEVDDTGPGFPAEMAGRLFQPYSTTRSHGTGLGLAISYRIIVEHGGWIEAGNRAEGGGRVVIRLPLEQQPGARRVPATAGEVRG